MEEIDWLGVSLDPSLILPRIGITTPDQWQIDFLRSQSDRQLLLCFRQGGKSTATACKALWTAVHEPGSLILILSPSQRQSAELFRKVCAGYEALGRPSVPIQDNAVTLALENGSRVVCLPGSPATVRGYSPQLVVIDEAARVRDDLLIAVRPMLTVSKGKLILLSTPFGKRGVFHDYWHDDSGPWHRTRITAEECPRVSQEFLAEERRGLGPRWYRQEYLCSFEETIDHVFPTESVLAAFDASEPPLFGDF
jgi:hypothetical protein